MQNTLQNLKCYSQILLLSIFNLPIWHPLDPWKSIPISCSMLQTKVNTGWAANKSITWYHLYAQNHFISYHVLPFRRFISYHFISSPIISYNFEKSSTIPTPKRHVSGTHSASHRDRQLVTLGRNYILPGKLTCPLKLYGWKMYFLLK